MRPLTLLWLVMVHAGISFAGHHAAYADSPRVLVIAADRWCPINCGEDDENAGIGVDLARHIFTPLGYRVHYIVMPWARALEEVRAGTVDAAVGANEEDDPTLVFPRHAIYSVTDTVYVLKSNVFPLHGLSSLSGKRIGIIKDYGYSQAVKDYVQEARKTPGMIQEVGGGDALEQNIRKLQLGRIDALIESSAVMEYMLKRLNLSEEIVAVGSVPQGNVYLAFSPKLEDSIQRAEQYDAGIRSLQHAGTLDTLYRVYGLRPPP